MDIDTAEFRDIEEFLRKNFPVSGDDDEVGLHIFYFLNLIIGDSRWLFDGNGIGNGESLDRRENGFLLSALGFVRLGEDGYDLVFILNQCLEECRGEIRRSHEHDPYLRGIKYIFLGKTKGHSVGGGSRHSDRR